MQAQPGEAAADDAMPACLRRPPGDDRHLQIVPGRAVTRQGPPDLAAAKCWPSWGRTAPARAPSSRRSAESTGPTPARSHHGRPVVIDGVKAALAAGVSVIHQELVLADNLDIAGNIFLDA